MHPFMVKLSDVMLLPQNIEITGNNGQAHKCKCSIQITEYIKLWIACPPQHRLQDTSLSENDFMRPFMAHLSVNLLSLKSILFIVGLKRQAFAIIDTPLSVTPFPCMNICASVSDAGFLLAS